MSKILSFLTILFLLSSCATKKEIIYFQDAESLNSKISEQSFEPIIESNDILYVADWFCESFCDLFNQHHTKPSLMDRKLPQKMCLPFVSCREKVSR